MIVRGVARVFVVFFFCFGGGDLGRRGTLPGDFSLDTSRSVIFDMPMTNKILEFEEEFLKNTIFGNE